MKYSKDFRFNEGIFLSYEQLKSNKPISIDRIISEHNNQELDFLEKVTSESVIKIKDTSGIVGSYIQEKIWGFSKNGTIYINYNNKFNRIPVVGAICHFVSDKTVYRERMMDPYYNYHTYPMHTTYKTKELRQYIFDFETGNVLSYNVQTAKIIFMRDPEIFDEFNSLKKRKQRQLLFLYVRKYNDANSLFFPK